LGRSILWQDKGVADGEGASGVYDIRRYQLDLKGEIKEAALNATSPVHVRVMQTDAARSCITFEADQSGLIGLLRHLHQQGFVLLSLGSEEPTVDSRS
jgi:hypothetical protein